jgi:hypothetical protein
LENVAKTRYLALENKHEVVEPLKLGQVQVGDISPGGLDYGQYVQARIPA